MNLILVEISQSTMATVGVTFLKDHTPCSRCQMKCITVSSGSKLVLKPESTISSNYIIQMNLVLPFKS